MAEKTKVPYAHHTASPWIGCTKKSEGCKFCYAEAHVDGRKIYGKNEPKHWGPDATRRPPKDIDAYWRKVRNWNDKAAKAGVKEPVLVSMCDVFDDHPSILPEWRSDFWSVVRETPSLIWIILTKRPENFEALLPPDWGDGYPNVWLGVSVENQEQAWRVDELRKTRATVKVISFEPLLGDPSPLDLTGIDGAFIGGESGRGARHTDINWIEAAVDLCRAYDVKVYVKQLGKTVYRSPESYGGTGYYITIKHPKGGNMAEWPENLRVQELPE